MKFFKLVKDLIMKKYYFDDPEGDALAKETSHPNFVENLTNDLYYDCLGDFSPFGNDDGSELLFSLEELYQEKKGRVKLTKWLFKTIDEYGFKYASDWCATIIDESTLKMLNDEDPHFITSMDNTIIATAFGQYKITGQIDSQIKDLAIIALKRQLLLNNNPENEVGVEHNEILNIMLNDLSRI